jgi:excisionase family DNA binding protein
MADQGDKQALDAAPADSLDDVRRDVDILLRQAEETARTQARLLRELRDVLSEDEDSLADVAPVLSATEVALLLRVSKATAYAMIRDGRLGCVRTGRRVTVSRQDLADYLRR